MWGGFQVFLVFIFPFLVLHLCVSYKRLGPGMASCCCYLTDSLILFRTSKCS